MSDEPQDAKGIFLAALDIADAAERAAFVERACAGDAALRKRVDDLLRAYDQADGPLDKLAAALAATEITEPIREQVGATIGPYKLMEQIGEGGFGLVFVAEQQQPIRRKVALKIIKPGMDTRDVIARFEAERQALALMDHPNIAKVLDAGTTDSGRPYFVMELVRGVPITDYCDQNQLTPRERLELFVPVCNAIQHAHLKGIIHRDIKPSNVLVTLHDGKPMVKVIDFGVAKALHQSLTDKTVYTRFAQMIGTPLYMSPEQAAMSGLDIDTRSDVYSLGVLLYELLTGMTPFDKQRLAKAAYDELLRILREEEPPKPSLRLSQSTGSLPSIAAQRKTEPAKLSKMFDGDLDWIAMKALEKDRTRRYETANGFAADVLRYLNDEPVEASPPSAIYRLRKLTRKHRAALLIGGSFAVLLFASVVVSSWLAIQEKAARDLSDQNAHLAEIEAQKARIAQSDSENEKRRSEVARAEAVRRRTEAESERARAEEERQRAVAAHEQSEHRLYASQIGMAQHAWEQNDIDGAWIQLNACRWDLRGWEHDYVFSLLSQSQKTLIYDQHRNGVLSVAYSPDGKQILSANVGSIRLWDARTGQAMLTLAELAGGAKFSPDGKQIIGQAYDRTATVWDASTGRVSLKLPVGGHDASFTPDGKQIVTGAGDGIAKVCDAKTGRELMSIEGSAEGRRSNFAFSAAGREFFGRSKGGALNAWDFMNGRARVIVQPSDTVRSICTRIAVSPDAQRIAAGVYGNYAIEIWDATNGHPLRTLRGHTAIVECVAFSPDGKRIASGGGDHLIKIWDANTGQEVLTLKAHGGRGAGVRSVAFSPDGNSLVSGGDDGTIRIWDLRQSDERVALDRKSCIGGGCVAFSPDRSTIACRMGDCGGPRGERTAIILSSLVDGRTIRTLDGYKKDVLCIAFSPDGSRLVSGDDDNTIKVWDVATGRSLLTLHGHADSVTCVSFSPDQRSIASGDDKGTLKIWDANDGHERATIKGNGQSIDHLAFSADGTKLATGGNNEITIRDPMTGEPMQTLHAGSSCLIFNPDGLSLISGQSDGTITVRDSRSGRKLRTLQGHTKEISSLLFTRDGKRLVSGSLDGAIRFWDLSIGQETLTLKSRGSVFSLAFSGDGHRLFDPNTSTVRIWKAASHQPSQALVGDSSSYSSNAVSPNGMRVARGSNDGAVEIWETTTGQRVVSLEGHSDSVAHVAFSTDGRQIISGSRSTIKIWSTETGRELLTLEGPGSTFDSAYGYSFYDPIGHPYHFVALSPDTRWIAVGGDDGTISIRSASTGKQLLSLSGCAAAVRCVAYSPDGKRLVSAHHNGRVAIWDVTDGHELRTLDTHGASVRCVVFSPNGQCIAGRSGNHTIKVWDVASGQEVQTFKGHTDYVTSVAFSPDGKQVASGSLDTTVKLWDIGTGLESRTFYGENAGIAHVAFSNDGREVFSISEDGRFRRIQGDGAQPSREMEPEQQSRRIICYLVGRATSKTDLAKRIESYSDISPEVRQRVREIAPQFWTIELHDRASDTVRSRYQELPLKSDVLLSLRNDPKLPDEVRAEATQLATDGGESEEALDFAARQIVIHKNRSREDYSRALRWAEASVRVESSLADWCSTLGIAQYRTGKYVDAIDSLTKTAEYHLKSSAGEGPLPDVMAFLAMAHHAAGHVAKAQEIFRQLTDLLKQKRWKNSAQAKSFFEEAKQRLETTP